MKFRFKDQKVPKNLIKFFYHMNLVLYTISNSKITLSVILFQTPSTYGGDQITVKNFYLGLFLKLGNGFFYLKLVYFSFHKFQTSL